MVGMCRGAAPELCNPGRPSAGCQTPGIGLRSAPECPSPKPAQALHPGTAQDGCLKSTPKAEPHSFFSGLAWRLCLCALKRTYGASRKGRDSLKASV